MLRSIGSNKINTAVFISGNGSNLRSLLKFSKLKKSPICIKLIISNKSKAKGLRLAKIFKIQKKTLNFFDHSLAEKKILSELKKKKLN